MKIVLPNYLRAPIASSATRGNRGGFREYITLYLSAISRMIIVLILRLGMVLNTLCLADQPPCRFGIGESSMFAPAIPFNVAFRRYWRCNARLPTAHFRPTISLSITYGYQMILKSYELTDHGFIE